MTGFMIAFLIMTFLLDITAAVFWKAPYKAYYHLSRICFICSIPMAYGFVYCLICVLDNMIYGG